MNVHVPSFWWFGFGCRFGQFGVWLLLIGDGTVGLSGGS